MNLISGTVLADKIYEKIHQHLKDNKIRSKMCLGIIQIGDDERSNKYIKVKQKKLAEMGWTCIHRKLYETISNTDFSNIIYQLVLDDSVHGIIAQLPMPKHIESRTFDDVPYDKDVDGLTLANQGMLFKDYMHGRSVAPCTALACMHFLQAHKVKIAGSHAAVFGRSCLVGRPISMMLQHSGATVVSINQEDKNQSILSRNCDILVSAMGVPHYITTDYVKQNAFVVDIGITQVENKMLGDIHPDVASHARWVSPTKDGIGPLTVAFLMFNLLKCFCLQNGEKLLQL